MNKKITVLFIIMILFLPVLAKFRCLNFAVMAVESSPEEVYVNETITTPVSEIGIPEEYIKPQIEEAGLEIVWNQWHADVRNEISKHIKKEKFPYLKHNINFVYTIDRNRNISDIVLLYVPEKALILDRKTYLAGGCEIYMYVRKTGKYYKLTNTGANQRYTDKNIPNIIKNFTKTEIPKSKSSFVTGTSLTGVKNNQVYTNRNASVLEKIKNNPVNSSKTSTVLANISNKEMTVYDIPSYIYLEPLVSSLEKQSGNRVFTFPEKSKRASVVVIHGYTNIDSLKMQSEYNASMFDDIEKLQ